MGLKTTNLQLLIGQISGFLAMDEFKRHFGQLNPQNGQYYFSTVRSGVIVGIVSHCRVLENRRVLTPSSSMSETFSELCWLLPLRTEQVESYQSRVSV